MHFLSHGKKRDSQFWVGLLDIKDLFYKLARQQCQRNEIIFDSKICNNPMSLIRLILYWLVFGRGGRLLASDVYKASQGWRYNVPRLKAWGWWTSTDAVSFCWCPCLHLSFGLLNTVGWNVAGFLVILFPMVCTVGEKMAGYDAAIFMFVWLSLVRE